MSDISTPQERKLPERILFGRYADGREYWLVQSKEIPGLYMGEKPLELPPTPSWLLGAMKDIEEERERRRKMNSWQRFREFLKELKDSLIAPV